MICLLQAEPLKRPPFGNERAQVVHNVLRSKNAQCNTKESPDL